MAETTIQKLESLITRVEAAILAIRDGKRVNLQTMDADSRTLQLELKKKPDPAARPLLLKAVMALERLTEALEKQTADLKAKRR